MDSGWNLKWNWTIPLMGKLQSAHEGTASDTFWLLAGLLALFSWLIILQKVKSWLNARAQRRRGRRFTASLCSTCGFMFYQKKKSTNQKKKQSKGSERNTCPTWRRRMNCGKRWMGFTIRPYSVMRSTLVACFFCRQKSWDIKRFDGRKCSLIACCFVLFLQTNIIWKKSVQLAAQNRSASEFPVEQVWHAGASGSEREV